MPVGCFLLGIISDARDVYRLDQLQHVRAHMVGWILPPKFWVA
jgi:hypothetical protein